jgi:hypothetical protein
MNSFYKLTAEQQSAIIQNVASKMGLSAAAVEKDIWVTCILQMLFCSDICGEIIFKGGTSLSKAYNLIDRFSEDIDISVNPKVFGLEGDLTKKQIKKLRKASSLFVEDVLAQKIQNAIAENNLSEFLSIDTEPLGEGDKTYPEPRRIFIKYKSVISQKYDYIKDSIILEIGARALMEPVNKVYVKSIVEECYPQIVTSIGNPTITTAAPQKTFIEKAFLLHELFSIPREHLSANRRSRHLYDLERMMDKDFAIAAINDNGLCTAIQHHRSVFTAVLGVDYSVDFRKNIVLIPPDSIIKDWENDYKTMCTSMIYGDTLDFKTLMNRMSILQERFKNN